MDARRLQQQPGSSSGVRKTAAPPFSSSSSSSSRPSTSSSLPSSSLPGRSSAKLPSLPPPPPPILSKGPRPPSHPLAVPGSSRHAYPAAGSSLPSSSHHSHHQFPSHSSRYPSQPSVNGQQQAPKPFRPYKLILDPLLAPGNPLVKRYNGKCAPEFSKHDFPGIPADPRRSRFKVVTVTTDLIFPEFQLDDSYTCTPPKREVAIFQLNDNVNQQFLEKMAEKCGDVEDVVVLRHPTTRRHLGMALLLFKRTAAAIAFVEANNEKTVMGTPIHCALDPYAAVLSVRYKEKTNGELEKPRHLVNMSDAFLEKQRETILREKEPKEPEASRSSSPVRPASSPLPPPDIDVDRKEENPPLPLHSVGLARTPPIEPEPTPSREPTTTESSPPVQLPEPTPTDNFFTEMPCHQTPMETKREPSSRSTSRQGREGSDRRDPMTSPPPNYHSLRRSPPPPYSRHSQRSSEKRPEKRKRRASSSNSSHDTYSDDASMRRKRGSRGGVGGGGGPERKECVRVKQKRYVSSERDSNGEKRIVEKTVTSLRYVRTERAGARSGGSDEERGGEGARAGSGGGGRGAGRRDHHNKQAAGSAPSALYGIPNSSPACYGQPTPTLRGGMRMRSLRGGPMRGWNGTRRGGRGFENPEPFVPNGGCFTWFPCASWGSGRGRSTNAGGHRWSTESSDYSDAEGRGGYGARKKWRAGRSKSRWDEEFEPARGRGESGTSRPYSSAATNQASSSSAARPSSRAETTTQASSRHEILSRDAAPAPPPFDPHVPPPSISSVLPSGLPPPPPFIMPGCAGAFPFAPPPPFCALPPPPSVLPAAPPPPPLPYTAPQVKLTFLEEKRGRGGLPPDSARFHTPCQRVSSSSNPNLTSSAPPSSTAESKRRRSPPPSPAAAVTTPPTSITKESKSDSLVKTPSQEKGSSTAPSSGCASMSLDDRLKALFGVRTKKSDENVSTGSPLKQESGDLPQSSSSTTEVDDARRWTESVEPEDMDVAYTSSSDESDRCRVQLGRQQEQQVTGNEKEDAKADGVCKKTVEATCEALFSDLETMLARDIEKRLSATLVETADVWWNSRKKEMEERRMEQVRESLMAVSAAARAVPPVTPVKDPMEQMMQSLSSAEKIHSPEDFKMVGIHIYKMPKCVSFKRKPRTPEPEDEHSRSFTPVSSRSPLVSDDDSDAAQKSSDEEDEGESRRSRPRMRNLDKAAASRDSSVSSVSSGSSSSSSLSSSDQEQVDQPSDDESSQEASFRAAVSTDIDEDEAEEGISSRTRSRTSSTSTSREASPAAISEAIPTRQKDLEEEVDVNEQQPQTTVPEWLAREEEAFTGSAKRKQIMRKTSGDGGGGRASEAKAILPPPVLRDDTRGILSPASLTQAVANVLNQSRAEIRSIPTGVATAAKESLPLQLAVPPKSFEKLPNEIKALLPSFDVPKKRPPAKITTKKFEKRSEEYEKEIFYSFQAGMDREDELYLKEALEQLQRSEPPLLSRDITFVEHTKAPTPRELTHARMVGRTELYYDDPELVGVVPNASGCARSEGFFRLTNRQKIRIMRHPEGYQDRTEISERDELAVKHQVQATREAKSMNRRLMTNFADMASSDFFKINQLKYRKKMIKFARSRIHGWGLYALEPIAPDVMIVEYVGQKIRPTVADEREKAYERRGIGSSYLFRIDGDTVIDATKMGNFARFINHSCQPNCYAKVVTVDGDKRIVIYSKIFIDKGDEITYDYKFPFEEDKIDCLCGAPNCRRFLN